ncbi:MAG: type II secretion system protein [Tissierella sp.]|nr:type II secretion system protein [Tissierella sp.]
MLKWINKKRNKKGFTLIELVVVIAILGVLGAIAVPRLGGFRTNATEAADKATAATIAKAAEMYVATASDSQEAIEELKTPGEGKTWATVLYEAGLIDVDADKAQTLNEDGDPLTFELEYLENEFVVKRGENILYPEKTE